MMNIIETRAASVSFGSRQDYPRRGLSVLTLYVRADRAVPEGWHDGYGYYQYRSRRGHCGDYHPVSQVAKALAPLTAEQKGVYVSTVEEVDTIHAREVQEQMHRLKKSPEEALAWHNSRGVVFVHRILAILPIGAVDALTSSDTKRPWWASYTPDVIRRQTKAAERRFLAGKIVVNTFGLYKLLAEGVEAVLSEGVADEYRFFHPIFNALLSGVVTHPVEGEYITTGEISRWMEGAGRNVWADPSALNRVARWSGWLKAAAKCPTLTKALQRNIFCRKRRVGFGYAYRQYIDLIGLMDTFRTPPQLERRMWKVRRRADAILSAYTGDYNPSWRNVINALLICPNHVGKAAVVAVALTLSGEKRWEKAAYRSAREWLVWYHVSTVRNESDGVIGRCEVEPYHTVDDGTSVYRLFAQSKGRNRVIALVVSPTGRTYHCEYLHSAECVVSDARRAWAKQDEAA